MVKYHIGTVGYTSGIILSATTHSHTDTQITDDNIAGSGKRSAFSVNDNTTTGSRLPGNCQILGKHKRTFNSNYTCHIKNNNAIRLTDSIT